MQPPHLSLADIPLDTDLEAAAALLDHPRAEPQFDFDASRFHRAKAADRHRRRGIKALIRPDNAAGVLPHLPGPGERTHCLLRGDFVLCDLIPQLIAAHGATAHLRIATLGLSAGNADTLAVLRETGQASALTLIVSHYFQGVDRSDVFRAVHTRLAPLARLVVTRSHAKVICIPTASAHFVIEGSANLRSSDNIEQMLITNDEETHAFHAAWLDELAAL